MITYRYRCLPCLNIFEIQRSIKDEIGVECPVCGVFTTETVIGSAGAPPILFNASPKTIGHLSDLNTSRMGRYERESHEIKQEEDRRRAIQHKIDFAKQKNPEYAEYIDSVKESDGADMSLNNLSDKQKERYILTGEK